MGGGHSGEKPKSDLDLSIDFFSYLFCIFQIILLPYIMFYPIITTLDGGGGGQGRNKQKRYPRGVTNDLRGGAGQE